MNIEELLGAGKDHFRGSKPVIMCRRTSWFGRMDAFNNVFQKMVSI